MIHCVQHLFICLFAIFCEASVQVFGPLLYLIIFLLLSFRSCLCILDSGPLFMSFAKYFLPLCVLSSHSLDSVFCRADVLNFNKVQLINYFFHNVNWKKYQLGASSPKRTYLEERKGCSPVHADIASHVPRCRVFMERKRKLEEGEVRTIELYYNIEFFL